MASAEAEAKGELMLRRLLSDEQWNDYEAYGHFFETKDGKLYRFGDKKRATVYELEQHSHTDFAFHLCIVFDHEDWLYMFKRPEMNPPEADGLIAQLLLLRYDKEKFDTIARRSEYTDYHVQRPETSQAYRESFDACVGFCEFPPHLMSDDEIGSFIGMYSEWPDQGHDPIFPGITIIPEEELCYMIPPWPETKEPGQGAGF